MQDLRTPLRGEWIFFLSKRMGDGYFSWSRNSAEARKLTLEQFG